MKEKFQYIFDKSMLIELASNGCFKNVINRLDKEWKEVCDTYKKDTGKDIFTINYIDERLTSVPFADKPPLARIKIEGEYAELLKLSELAYRNKIVTENNGKNKYDEFISDEELVIFNQENRDLLNERIDSKKNISSKDFKVNLILEEKELLDKFKKIFNPNKYNFVYQPQFKVPNNFFVPLLKNDINIENIINGNELIFRALRPDLIKILPKETECTVLDKNFNIKASSLEKIKLQVCDIKMSDFSNKYFVELGLYMIALNTFIYNNKVLHNNYEVISEGLILPENINLDKEERQCNIELNEVEVWRCDFATVKNKLIGLFNNNLVDLIKIVENRDLEKYESVQINSKCQTCDYYGGQFSENLKRELKRILEREPTDEEVKEYLENPKNNYCRYCLKYGDSINVLSTLKNGEKKLLINKNIKDNDSLYTEITDTDSAIFKENRTLRADKVYLKKSLDVRREGANFSRTNNNTLNIPKYSNLTVFIDERHDTQGRSLSFAFSYMFNGIDEHGQNISENNFREPYISIVEENSSQLEKRKFLDFLIKLNEVFIKYEDCKTNFGGAATFSILYWSEEVISHMKEMFLDIVKYFTNYGEGIDEIYINLPKNMIEEKKKDIKKLLYRFNLFFTSDDKLQDYRIVENNPFFDIRKGIEDLLVFNIDYNNTLIKVYNMLSNESKPEIFCKPDSDQFSADVFTRVWMIWKDSTEKDTFIREKVTRVLKERLYCLQSIFFKLNDYKTSIKGIAPEIPVPTSINLYQKLKYGTDLVFFQRLNSTYSKIEKQVIHNDEIYSKSVLGKSVFLEQEIVGVEKDRILNTLQLNNTFSKNYRVYRMFEDSAEAKIDSKSIFLTMYPETKSEFIFRKFSSIPGSEAYAIYYNKDEDELKGVKLYKSKEKGYKMYLEAFNVKIESFDRYNKIVVIEIPQDSQKILEYMEIKYDFDFTKNIVLEEIHVDIWEKKLKGALDRLQKNVVAKKIIEDFEHKEVNSIVEDDVNRIISEYYNGGRVPLDSSQQGAIVKMINNLLTILWGPPGTGKSHTIAHFLLYLYLTKEENTKKVLLLGNYDATDNILADLIKLLDRDDVSAVRVKSSMKENGDFSTRNNIKYRDFTAGDNAEEIMKLKESFQIFSSTPDQVEKVFSNRWGRKFSFDYIIVDEASQMDVGHFLPGLIKVSEKTQFIIAGDHLQLEPVLKVKIKNSEINIFGSIYEFFNKEYGIKYPEIRAELKNNRRSNKIIVDFGKIAFDYPSDYKADELNENAIISFSNEINNEEFYDNILEPSRPIVLLSYNDGFSHQSNEFEASEVAKLVEKVWEKGLVKYGEGKVYDIIEFFDSGIGIVVPHRAQRTLIQYKLMKFFLDENDFGLDNDSKEKLKQKIISAVDTVEKYQGQQREIMICSYVLGDTDMISNEEEFIFNPNRLNVIISRARFKAIVIASEQLLSHTSDTLEVIEKQKSLHKLMEYCNEELIVRESNWKQLNGKCCFKSI